ncbi:MAG TPA: DUF4350 domain-containing protein [Chthoniobacteraceae bacterium]|jgi:hypothetical protein
MLKQRTFVLLLAFLIAGGFCFGVAQLFLLQYRSGEVYPPYSSLRPDPLGTKAIYEALQKLPESEVRRNFRPLKKLQPGQPVTLVYLGVERASDWTEREFQEFESLVFNGSRAVFAFFPMEQNPAPAETLLKQQKARADKEKRVAKESDEPGLMSFAQVGKRLGFSFAVFPAAEDKSYQREARAADSTSTLEPKISWHSALHFSELTPEWKPLYLSESQPVVIERQYGRGSILLAADSYFVSNEALRKERLPQLLARLFSGPSPVIFDEEHLGVVDEQGVAQLALKYRLHGVIAGLALIAFLSVWKSSVRFLPPIAGSDRDPDFVVGKDVASGFSNLLRRAIAPQDLLPTCVAEWRRLGHEPRALAAVEEVWAEEQTRPPRQRNPLAVYRAISQRLARKTKPHSS